MSINQLWGPVMLKEDQNIIHAKESRSVGLKVVNSADAELYQFPAVAPTNNDVMVFQANGSCAFADVSTVGSPYALLNDSQVALSSGIHLKSAGNVQDMEPSLWLSEDLSGMNLLAGSKLTQFSATSISNLETEVADNGNVNLTITGGLSKKFAFSDEIQVSKLSNAGSKVNASDGLDINGASDLHQKLSVMATTQIQFKACNASVASNVNDLEFTGVTTSYKFDKDIFSANSLVQTANNGAVRPVAPVAGQMFFDTAISKPIWYTGAQWVLADGTPA